MTTSPSTARVLALFSATALLFRGSPAAAAATHATEPTPPPDLVEVIPDETTPTPPPPIPPTSEAATPTSAPPTAQPGPSSPQRAPPPSSRAALARPVPIPDRFQLSGWARQSVELGFSSNAARPDDLERTLLPYDRVVSRSQLFMSTRYSRERWFEADVSGLLSYSAFEQGPASDSTQFNGFNGQSVRGSVEPRLYELFVGFFSSNVDLRIGQQRIAWGKGDFVSPNDVVNARDTRDPFVGETETQHIPTLAARLDLDFGFGTLEGVASPAFTPDRFDVFGSNWAALQPDAPIWARGLANIVRRSTDPTLQEAVEPLLSATHYPKSDFTAPVLSGRWAWALRGADFSYYYQYGFDGPLISIDPALISSLSGLDYSQAGLSDLEPLLQAIDAGQKPIRIRYVRRHHVGMDAATTVGAFALRLDAAYDSERVFVRTDFLGAMSPTFQGVASIEYQTGDKDKDILLEGIYQRVFEYQPVPLLIYDRDSVGTAVDLRWPLWDPVSLEMRAMLGFLPRSQVVQPQLNVKFGSLVLSGGGLWLGGSQFSFGEYFHRNRETYLKAKYSF